MKWTAASAGEESAQWTIVVASPLQCLLKLDLPGLPAEIDSGPLARAQEIAFLPVSPGDSAAAGE